MILKYFPLVQEQLMQKLLEQENVNSTLINIIEKIKQFNPTWNIPPLDSSEITNEEMAKIFLLEFSNGRRCLLPKLYNALEAFGMQMKDCQWHDIQGYALNGTKTFEEIEGSLLDMLATRPALLEDIKKISNQLDPDKIFLNNPYFSRVNYFMDNFKKSDATKLYAALNALHIDINFVYEDSELCNKIAKLALEEFARGKKIAQIKLDTGETCFAYQKIKDDMTILKISQEISEIKTKMSTIFIQKKLSSTDKKVVIKKSDPFWVKKEVKAIEYIHSFSDTPANIQPALKAWDEDYMVMHCYVGDLDGSKKVTGKELNKKIQQIIAPVKYLHDKGLVHLDIKPGNFFVDENNSPVLADLTGMSKADDALSSEVYLFTRAYSLSTDYSQIEAARNPTNFAQLKKKKDVYSLGITAFCLATGMNGIQWTQFITRFSITDDRGLRINDVISFVLAIQHCLQQEGVQKETIALIRGMMEPAISLRLSTDKAWELANKLPI